MDPTGEWSRKIVEVYMTWYTFFVTTNFAVMGYLFTKEAKEADLRGVRLLACLFIVFNLLGTGSTILVGVTAGETAPPVFHHLIQWGVGSNAVGLLGNVCMWGYIVYSRRTAA